MPFAANIINNQNHTFVPVEPSVSISAKPTFHDKLPAEGNRFTGTLFCTMHCLTPTLVGCHQIGAQHFSTEAVNVIRNILPGNNNEHVTEMSVSSKKIIQPLMLPAETENQPGKVLIAADALKSALLRAPLQALLNAPMERVAERTIAYRVFAPSYSHSRLFQVGASTEGGGVSLIPLDSKSVLWPRTTMDTPVFNLLSTDPDVPNHFAFPIEDDFAIPNSMRMLTADGDPTNIIISSLDETFPLQHGFYVFRYGGGLDGDYALARDFSPSSVDQRGNDYRCLLTKYQHNGAELEVSPNVLHRFSRTIEHIYNKRNGHLANHPQMRSDSVKRAMESHENNPPELRTGELVWAEVHENEVRSLGRWRSYLWSYRDTVLRRFDQEDGGERFRGEIKPLNVETKALHSNSFQLSAGRNFHGFVATQSEEPRVTDPNTMGIGGEEGLNALAGRIHVTYAKEVLPRDGDRFMGDANNNHLVLGRPVGAARVSSAEIYLKQKEVPDNNNEHRRMKTWGEYEQEQLSGGLAGRKIFPHAQPVYQFDPVADVELGQTGTQAEQRAKTACADHVPMMRFISTVDTQFRFAVRLENLKPWELGAILFCLTRDRNDVRELLAALDCTQEELSNLCKGTTEVNGVAGFTTQERVQPDLAWIFQDANDNNDVPDFALKIGYHRQYGMGSVKVDVDHVQQLQFANSVASPILLTSEQIAESKQAFYQFLAGSMSNVRKKKAFIGAVLAPWLDAFQFNSKKDTTRSYRKSDGSVLNYHKQVRDGHRNDRNNNIS